MSSSRQLQRKGLPVMSDIQMGILRQLVAAKKADAPFIALPGVHPRTLKAMMNHDWILESPGMDGIKYKITGRGEHALSVYSAPSPRHDDGLCPCCRRNPVHVCSTGRNAGYCQQCKNLLANQHYKRAPQQIRSVVCPQCGERPRQQYNHGRYHAYCKECRHANRAEERRTRRQRDLERVQRGEFLPCRCCHEKPRYVTGKTVQDYCIECHRRNQRRWAFARVLAK